MPSPQANGTQLHMVIVQTKLLICNIDISEVFLVYCKCNSKYITCENNKSSTPQAEQSLQTATQR